MWYKALMSSFVLAGFASCVLGSEQREVDMTPQELIQGVMARSEAVFSGKIDYRLSSGFAKDTKEKPGEHMLIFSGSSWKLYSKYVASEVPVAPMPPKMKQQIGNTLLSGFLEITSLSHHGKFVKYGAAPQFDGSVHHSADLTREQPIDYSFPGPPVFAGSLWYDCTRHFIQDKKDKVVSKPDVEVNGVKAKVLEWEVLDTEKFNAFHAANRGGFLRLYVSPELGFSLPRFEHVGPDGLIDASYDSVEFKESVPGIFIPRNCRMQYYANGVPGFYIEYEITGVAKINNQVADSEFVIQLPPGTIVGDSRDGKSSTIFEIQQGGPIPEDLADIIAVEPPPPFWGRNWHSAVIVGIGGGLLLLALFILGRRVRSRRRNP